MSFAAAIAHRQREQQERELAEKLTKQEDVKRKRLLRKTHDSQMTELLDPDDLDQRLEMSLQNDSNRQILFVPQKPHLSVIDATTVSARQKLTIRNPKQVLGDTREATMLVEQVHEHQRAAEVAEAFKRDERERTELLLREVGSAEKSCGICGEI